MFLRVACIVLLLAACGKQDAANTLPASRPSPAAVPPALQAEPAFPNLAFSSPLLIANAGDGSDRFFVVEQAGRILVFPNDAAVTSAKTFLDIRAQVLSGGELGLLGLAFDPDYATNGFFYVNYTIDKPPHSTRISRFRASIADPDQADVTSEQVLLEFEQPFDNHNGGMLAFGPDGKLYIATGDGGSGNDPNNNAQSLNTVLGKILRINTNGSIPSDNPFANDPTARGEIWAYGLRNPFRMSFDRATGRLWAGDVGQSAREEVDVVEKGGNYGWRIYEGNRSNVNPMDLPSTDFIAPVLDYDRNAGTTVIGGYVYHGPGLPDYGGVYIYGDFGSGRIWALVYDSNTKTVVSNAEVATLANIGLSSFGENEAGELYAVGLFDGKIYRFRQL